MEIHASCSVNLFITSARRRGSRQPAVFLGLRRAVWKRRTLQECEWVAAKAVGSNGCRKYYVADTVRRAPSAASC
ncbi:hypothetical protein IL54_2931 [Sphingobium sp. ba1]|nr:hypothetical protein IL54_2931 [Sphingobium sp. ba1]